MRVSHFAKIQVIVPPEEYTPDGATAGKAAILKTVGLAQNINIDDNFGTRAENTIGTPLPVLAPGYQVTNIRLEKATLDGSDFRNLGAFNPLWAHVGQTYQSNNRAQVSRPGTYVGIPDKEMFPFMFVLAVQNRVARSYSKTNIGTDNKPVAADSEKARSNPFGIYVCVLQSATISMSSQQAVIMDSITAVARPLTGTWLTDAVKNAFSTNGDAKNGMKNLVTEILYGYFS